MPFGIWIWSRAEFVKKDFDGVLLDTDCVQFVYNDYKIVFDFFAVG